MLKQPDRIVIYPQRDSKPGYLLCWIPPREYPFVSGDSPDVETELQEYYPTGIETEFSLDGFEEFGIVLPYDIDALSQAFISLDKAGVFRKMDFVELKRLQDFAAVIDQPPIPDLLQEFKEGEISLDELKENGSFKKLLQEPKSRGEEDPGQAFQKLAGQMESADE